MATFILTWNPDCWDVADMADELAATGRASTHWTTVSRKIRAGDTVVFLRQGVEPRGVVGLGRATARPWNGGRRWYCPLDWLWLEPEAPVLTVAELQALVPTGHWVPRCSGTRVGDVEAAVLLDLLRDRLPIPLDQ